MFSACGGLAFALSSLLKLSSYEAFLMPLPVLLCALRNGGSAGRKAVRSTVILLAGKHSTPALCIMQQVASELLKRFPSPRPL